MLQRLTASAALVGLGLAFAAAAADPPRVSDERSRSLLQAETDLAAANTAAALDALELLASTGHSLEVELGLVRAQMQAGQYRRAAAFAAHVAGEHADHPSAAVLYAWLLRLGGQGEAAERVLRAAHDLAPSDPVVSAAARAFASALPAPTGILLDWPHRLAPFAAGTPGESLPVADARVVSGGVLLEGGGFALVPSIGMASAGRRLWVRNGLGESREAEVAACSPTTGTDEVSVLRLRRPLAGALPLAARDPYAGSPGFAFEYPFAVVTQPVWPLLRQGFLGAVRGPAGERSLSIEVATQQQGGAVLDAGGNLAGMVQVAGDSRSLLRPVSRWPRLGECTIAGAARASADPAPRPPQPISADEAYERGLRVTLQVLAAP